MTPRSVRLIRILKKKDLTSCDVSPSLPSFSGCMNNSRITITDMPFRWRSPSPCRLSLSSWIRSPTYFTVHFGWVRKEKKKEKRAFSDGFRTGVAVVAVLDNTIGGFLTLGIQRIMGTIIGGVASIVIMTIVRSIFRNNWDWRPTLLLCVLMFIQIFFIAKIKLIPNYSYAGSIVRI